DGCLGTILLPRARQRSSVASSTRSPLMRAVFDDECIKNLVEIAETSGGLRCSRECLSNLDIELSPGFNLPRFREHLSDALRDYAGDSARRRIPADIQKLFYAAHTAIEAEEHGAKTRCNRAYERLAVLLETMSPLVRGHLSQGTISARDLPPPQ